MTDSHGSERCKLRRNSHQCLSARRRQQHDSQGQAGFLRIVGRIWDLWHSTESVCGAARQTEQRSVAVGRQSVHIRIDISIFDRKTAENLYHSFAVEYLFGKYGVSKNPRQNPVNRSGLFHRRHPVGWYLYSMIRRERMSCCCPAWTSECWMRRFNL